MSMTSEYEDSRFLISLCCSPVEVLYPWSLTHNISSEDLNRECGYTCHKVNEDTKSNEPVHDKTYNMACAPSEDSDQPGHQPSLISVFALRSMGS